MPQLAPVNARDVRVKSKALSEMKIEFIGNIGKLGQVAGHYNCSLSTDVVTAPHRDIALTGAHRVAHGASVIHLQKDVLTRLSKTRSPLHW